MGDLDKDIPDINSISEKLTKLIDALPDIDPHRTNLQEQEIVDLWQQRNALDDQLRISLEELHSLQCRLTAVHQAMVIGQKRAKDD